MYVISSPLGCSKRPLGSHSSGILIRHVYKVRRSTVNNVLLISMSEVAYVEMVYVNNKIEFNYHENIV